MRASLIILAILGVCGALRLESAVFIPAFLALYGAVLLSPPVEFLCRLGWSRLLSSGLIMLVVVALLAGVVNITSGPAQAWIERAPQTLRDIELKLRPLTRAAGQLEKVAAHAERIAAGQSAPTPVATPAAGILNRTLHVAVPLVGVFFMMLFLLACGPPILRRIAESRHDDAAARRVIVIGERVRREMSRYLGILSIINAALGVATGLLCMLFELPNPMLWGVMAGVFNFVPYVGSATTLVVISAVTLLTYDLHHALGIALCYLALETIQGQLVQPLAVGNRLSLNPLAIFLALWAWGGLWGVAGLVLATPMLLTVRIIVRRLPSCRTFSDFLAPVRPRPLAAKARAWGRKRRRERARQMRAEVHAG